MSIRSAGKIIRTARLAAGLSQEKLAEDICSPTSLNKIENNKQGVNAGTFQLLMQKTGASSELYPMFENQEDLDCFLKLKEVRRYINLWNLDQAYSHLLDIESLHYAYNKI